MACMGFDDVVVTKRFQTIVEAKTEADKKAKASGGTVIEGRKFDQGSRAMVTALMRFHEVNKILHSAPATGGSNARQVRESTNRKLNSEHAQGFADYLSDNWADEYFVPPFALNFRTDAVAIRRIEFYVGADLGDGVGYLVIPPGVKIDISDGQHRELGIRMAIEHAEAEDDMAAADALRSSSVIVMLTFSSRQQAQQDFTDAGKTLRLPPSLTAAYDRRNPANAVSCSISELADLLRDRTDSSMSRIARSANNANLFTQNAVRQFVKAYYFKQAAMSEALFERRSKLCFCSVAERDASIEAAVDWLDAVTAACPVLAAVAALPVGNTAEAVAAARTARQSGSIALTVTGLIIIGLVGYDYRDADEATRARAAAILGSINWSIDAGFWSGILVAGGKVLTSASAISRAIDRVRNHVLEQLDGRQLAA